MKFNFVKPAMLAAALLLVLIQQAVAENPFDLSTNEDCYRDSTYIVTQGGGGMAMGANSEHGPMITVHGGGKLMDSSGQNMDHPQGMDNMNSYEGQTCGGTQAMGTKSSYGYNSCGCNRCNRCDNDCDRCNECNRCGGYGYGAMDSSDNMRSKDKMENQAGGMTRGTMNSSGEMKDTSNQNMQSGQGYNMGTKSSYGANSDGKCSADWAGAGDGLASGRAMGSDGQYGTGGSAMDRAGADYEQEAGYYASGMAEDHTAQNMSYGPAGTAGGYMTGTKSSAGYQPDMSGQQTSGRGRADGSCSAIQGLHDTVRKLWSDHVNWARVFIIGGAAGLADQPAVVNRLQQNAAEMGKAIGDYYGDAAGSRMTALFQEHVSMFGDLFKAMKANDQARVQQLMQQLDANVDQQAATLSNLNPQWWPQAQVAQLLHEHETLLGNEAKARLAKDWMGDVAAADQVLDQALQIGDAMADGIAGQFPQQFR